MTNVECQISNAEVKRAFLQLIRGNSFNEEELKVFFRNVYTRIERDYPENTKWAYDYVSRKYTKQLGEELKEERGKSKLDRLYRGDYS